MKQSDMNHLRRLLGWIRCEIGLPPAEQQRTMISIAEKLGECGIDTDAKARLVEGYRRAEAVPVYVRDAVNALEKSLPAPGRGPGAGGPRATAETRIGVGFDPGAAAGREPGGAGHLKRLAADLGNRDWKWWDSCSFRRLTFEDGPSRRDGSALHGTVQASDGHPDVSMAPGVREFIEATSPQAIASLCDDLAAKNRVLEIVRSELAALVLECDRADDQAARELRRTFIYPNVLEGAKRVLAASLQEVQP